MFYKGPPRSGKTQYLVDVYLEHINNNINPEEILVVTSNAYRKQDFLFRVRQNLTNGFPQFNIQTFFGIVYNTINAYWPLIENKLKGEHVILPLLSGLETCEFILKRCIKTQNSKKSMELTFNDFYGDKSLITQLIRRYRLMAENMLSFDEISKISIEIGQEYIIPANESIKCLKLNTSKLRTLDFVAQMNAFNYLYAHEDRVKKHFELINHLIVDDFDENFPLAQEFIKYLIPKQKSVHIAFDPEGGTRRGYLSAYSAGWKDMIKDLDVKDLTSNAQLTMLAETIYNSIKNNNPVLSNDKIFLSKKVHRIDMFEDFDNKLSDLLFKNNEKIDNIVVVIPQLDNITKAYIKTFCDKYKLNYQFMTGSNKPIDNERVFGAIILLQILNPDWNIKITRYDIRLMLFGLLNFPVSIADLIAQDFEEHNKKLNPPTLPQQLSKEISSELLVEYNLLLSYIDNSLSDSLPLIDRLTRIFIDIISPRMYPNETSEDYNKIIKSLSDFSKFKNLLDKNSDIKVSEKEWLVQLKNELIAENPVTPDKVLPNTLVVATPQKIVDMELSSDYQLWLDVSASGWTRRQTAALYNAWAYSKYYDGSLYDDERFTRSITAHVIRSLIYFCNKQILAFSSIFDSTGVEQQGWLIKFLEKEHTITKSSEEFNLRDDQSDICQYKSGTMAIAAVPGAGKTYVNVALIAKLIENGVLPENILVLTFMESASQTIIRRIRTIFPDLKVLPYISTIHGVAYKMMRDDNHLSLLGLNEDIKILDETNRPEIMSMIISKTIPDFENLKDWQNFVEAGIKIAKTNNISLYQMQKCIKANDYQQLKEFYEPYKIYLEELKSRGIIDFDDQIKFAIDLLTKFPEVKEKYNQKFLYVIEDEAQDSTKLQQKLLSLLIEKNNNYIRTGDLNQAIMTTFTPVDIDGFKNFINFADIKITMNKSQRCAEPIFSMANYLIDWSKTEFDLKDAFLDIKMMPVDGKNPKIYEQPIIQIFENSQEEVSFTANKIVELLKKNPNSTYAVLVRNNADAVQWANLLDSYGLNCLCLTDNLKQRTDFNLIHSYLKVLNKPYNNKYIKHLFSALLKAELIEDDYESYAFLDKLGSPFISFDINELPTALLAQLYVDIQYWISFSNLPPSEIIIKMATEIFVNAVDKSNVYLLSILVEKYTKQQAELKYFEAFTSFNDEDNDTDFKTALELPDIVNFFDNMARVNKLSAFKFFEKEEDDSLKAGYVQVMTIHKSKGMGFDSVFVPHLWENSFYYPTYVENVKDSSLSNLELQLMEAAGRTVNIEEYKYKSRKNQIEETLRLIYVAITRAKKNLHLTSSNYNSKMKREEAPSRILNHLKTLVMEDISV